MAKLLRIQSKGTKPVYLEATTELDKYNFPAGVLKKILAFRKNQKQQLTGEQLKRIPIPRYLPVNKELVTAVTALLYGQEGAEWEAPLLIGPKGSGKSTLAETLAAILMLPVTKIFGGIDVNAEALLGAKTLGFNDDNESNCDNQNTDGGHLHPRIIFEPGLLLRAVQTGEMLVVDEVNMLVPEVTSILHGLLDWQKCLSVPGVGMVAAHCSFRLVAAMNFGYVGTKILNESFQDRFRSITVPYLSTRLLAELLVRETKCSAEVAGILAGLFNKLANRVQNGDLSERVLSVRTLYRIIREYQDQLGSLKEISLSAFTEGLSDQFEKEQVTDIIDAVI